jgi:hypothetical protein
MNGSKGKTKVRDMRMKSREIEIIPSPALPSSRQERKKERRSCFPPNGNLRRGRMKKN